MVLIHFAHKKNENRNFVSFDTDVIWWTIYINKIKKNKFSSIQTQSFGISFQWFIFNSFYYFVFLNKKYLFFESTKRKFKNFVDFTTIFLSCVVLVLKGFHHHFKIFSRKKSLWNFIIRLSVLLMEWITLFPQKFDFWEHVIRTFVVQKGFGINLVSKKTIFGTVDLSKKHTSFFWFTLTNSLKQFLKNYRNQRKSDQRQQ